jgi:hypothetical protein
MTLFKITLLKTVCHSPTAVKGKLNLKEKRHSLLLRSCPPSPATTERSVTPDDCVKMLRLQHHIMMLEKQLQEATQEIADLSSHIEELSRQLQPNTTEQTKKDNFDLLNDMNLSHSTDRDIPISTEGELQACLSIPEKSRSKLCIISNQRHNGALAAIENAFDGSTDYCHYAMPNCTINGILKTLKNKLLHFTLSDYCVILLGEIDFINNPDNTELIRNIRSEVQKINHTNVIICLPTYICGAPIYNIYVIETFGLPISFYLPLNYSNINWKRSLIGISSLLYFDLLFDMYIIYPVIVYNKVFAYIHTTKACTKKNMLTETFDFSIDTDKESSYKIILSSYTKHHKLQELTESVNSLNC